MRNLMSNYGWAIVSSLIIAVIIALATPFGTYIARTVINITKYAGTTAENVTGDGYENMEEEYQNMFGENVVYIEPGLYETGGTFKKIIKNWDDMLKDGSDKKSNAAILIVKKDEADGVLKLQTQYNNGSNPSYDDLNGDLVIKGNLYAIASYGFAECKYLSSVSMKSIQLIEPYAFKNCKNIETVYLNSTNLKLIEENAFLGCSKLSTIYFNGTFKEFQSIKIKEQQLGNTISVICKDKTVKIKFGETPVEPEQPEVETLAPGLYAEDGTMTMNWEEFLNLTCRVICRSCDRYVNGIMPTVFVLNDGCLSKNDYNEYYGICCEDDDIIKGYVYSEDYWGDIKTKLVLDKSVTSLDDYLFGGCYNMREVVIPNSVVKIGNNAFGNCDDLTDVIYNGTKAEWENINKADVWFVVELGITIHCTDGDIVIPAVDNK